MKQIKPILFVIALVILSAFVYQTQEFQHIIARRLTVLNAATFQPVVTLQNGASVTAGGVTITAGGATVTDGGLTLSDDNVVIADFVQITPQTAISVTDGSVITPTGSYQPLESAGAVTATLSSGCTAGRDVTLVNTVAQAIVISETATSALSGNATLNQYDAMQFLCDGTRWIQVAPESDN